jgi:hypothetical protein
MGSDWVFTHIEAELLPVLEELRRREPIFHSQEFGISATDYARRTAPTVGKLVRQGDDIVASSYFESLPANRPSSLILWLGRAGTTPLDTLALIPTL